MLLNGIKTCNMTNTLQLWSGVHLNVSLFLKDMSFTEFNYRFSSACFTIYEDKYTQAFWKRKYLIILQM